MHYQERRSSYFKLCLIAESELKIEILGISFRQDIE